MATVTTPEFRSLRIGELFDQAIRIYRRNFFKFIAILAVVQIPLTLLQFLAVLPSQIALTGANSYEELSLISLGGGVLNCFTTLLSFVLVQGVATAATTRAVADGYLGRSTGFVEAYRRIRGRWTHLVVALLLASLINIGLVIWVLVPCVGWVTGLGLLFFFATVIIPLIAPIIVLERKGPVEAIRRAWDLVRRRFWWVVGFVALLWLFSQIVTTGPAFLVGILLGLLFESVEVGGVQQSVIQTLAGLPFTLLYLPLQLTAVTLLYFDLRVRTEAFDLIWQTRETLEDETDADLVLAQAPPPERGNLITWTEVGYFVLLTLAVGGVAALLYVVIGGLLAAFLLPSGGVPGGF